MPPPGLHGWKQLKTGSKIKHPHLFYHYDVSNSCLLLQLTDLVKLWQCELLKSDIISEAAEQHCSIDPSESKDQLHVFLSKLRQSLETGSNSLASIEVRDWGELHLRTQMSLPRPLQPLIFIFRLRSAFAVRFSNSVVRPILDCFSTLRSQVSSLEEEIKAKDRVISKLLDRIDNQAVDMSIIFPTLTGAGGRKGNVGVAVAKQKIKGLEAFDNDSWRKDFEEEGIDGITEMAGASKSSDRKDVQDEEWVKKLPGPESLENTSTSQTKLRASQSQSQSQLRSQKVLGSDHETASEDEFERQATPPSLRKKRLSPDPRSKAYDLSESSAAEDDLPPSKRQKTGRIRGMGGSKPAPKPEQRRSDATDATETAPSSSEAESGKTSNEQQQQQQPPPQKSKKLGGLRSKSKAPVSPMPAESPSSSPPARPPSSHASTSSRRLGRLGKGRQRTATVSPVSEEKQPSQPATPSRRLGRIGIKKQTQSPIPEAKEPKEDSASASEDDNEDLDAAITARTEGKDLTASPQPSSRPTAKRSKTPDVKQGDTPAPALSPTKPIETEEEKAVRRKEELKTTITSAPAKKKRRF